MSIVFNNLEELFYDSEGNSAAPGFSNTSLSSPHRIKKRIRKLHSSPSELIKRGLVWYSEERTQPPYLPCSSKVPCAPFEIKEIDSVLPGSNGLAFGKAHEWLMEGYPTPPLSVPLILLQNGIKAAFYSGSQSSYRNPFNRYIVWIGQECWPTATLLKNTLAHSFGTQILSHCLFLNPSNKKQQLECIETALGSSAVFCTFAALKELSLCYSKRFSLLLKNRSALAFFLFSSKSSSVASASASRWQLSPVPLQTDKQGYKLSLLQLKGAKPIQTEWLIEVQNESTQSKPLSLALSSELVDRSQKEETILTGATKPSAALHKTLWPGDRKKSFG